MACCQHAGAACQRPMLAALRRSGSLQLRRARAAAGQYMVRILRTSTPDVNELVLSPDRIGRLCEFLCRCREWPVPVLAGWTWCPSARGGGACAAGCRVASSDLEGASRTWPRAHRIWSAHHLRFARAAGGCLFTTLQNDLLKHISLRLLRLDAGLLSSADGQGRRFGQNVH